MPSKRHPKGKPARSVILLWLGGAASQLDTFDPHPTTKIGGGVKTIPRRSRASNSPPASNKLPA
jgi:hypothetical protein